jgi:hypothetical protein
MSVVANRCENDVQEVEEVQSLESVRVVNRMSWDNDSNLILLEVIHATDPHNSNYGEKSKNWKEAIKTMKEFLLKDLKLVAPLNEQSVSKHLEELLDMYKKRQGESRGAIK